MFHIGDWPIDKPTVLAPMAGITDLPFRNLCRLFGAGLTVSEMVTADKRLWHSRKSQLRLLNTKDLLNIEAAPRAVQIVGSDPKMMADAAVFNESIGAHIIDINMGCPAKKVCKKAAGSALLQDEKLVERILAAVVKAVTIPVTLKIRTGWDPKQRNGAIIARIAEECGVSALAVHGRTRACRFKAEVEYDTIANIVEQVSIPVFANGDIDSPEKAKAVLAYTKANAVMIGRAAQGNPWLFEQINHFLSTGTKIAAPTLRDVGTILVTHIRELHNFYGEHMGSRIARKHLGWYLRANHLHTDLNGKKFLHDFNQIMSTQEQLTSIQDFFKCLLIKKDTLNYELSRHKGRR